MGGNDRPCGCCHADTGDSGARASSALLLGKDPPRGRVEASSFWGWGQWRVGMGSVPQRLLGGRTLVDYYITTISDSYWDRVGAQYIAVV